MTWSWWPFASATSASSPHSGARGRPTSSSPRSARLAPNSPVSALVRSPQASHGGQRSSNGSRKSSAHSRADEQSRTVSWVSYHRHQAAAPEACLHPEQSSESEGSNEGTLVESLRSSSASASGAPSKISSLGSTDAALKVRIHPDLTLRPDRWLSWDVLSHPSQGVLHTSRSKPSSLHFDDPACSPGLPSITISFVPPTDTSTTTPNPHLTHLQALWGPILIQKHPSSFSPIRVKDVLLAIHTYFAQPLTHAECRYLSSAQWDVAKAAWHRRVAQIRMAYPGYLPATVVPPVVRADLFGGATRFGGIMPVKATKSKAKGEWFYLKLTT
uniref:DUF6699 domain-containing protein n=1 Tax=Mycena chlorophos TaxID=658473 RepID=A0ABQ0LNS3_MYCCL|nr:predicted protein [Mycena chlorophos]